MSDNQSENSGEWGQSSLLPSGINPMKHVAGKFGSDGLIYVDRVEKIPTEAHLAALQTSTISTPGYDRDDPPSSETIIRYIAFETVEACRKWILEQDAKLYRGDPYVIIRANPMQVTKTINIDLG